MTSASTLGGQVSDAAVFGSCTRRQKRRLEALSTVVVLPAGRELTQQGAPGREFGIILSGAAEVRIGDRAIAVLGPGDHYGELALLGDSRSRHLRHATVTTTEPTKVAAMSVNEFSTLLDEMPEVADAITRTAEQRQLANAHVTTS